MATRNRHILEIVSEYQDKASGGIGGLSDALGGLDGVVGGLATGGVVALGAALVGVGVHAFNLAGDVEDSAARMQAQLGLSADEADRFEGVMENIFANNFGENFADIGESLSIVEQNFRRIGESLPDDELQSVTETALAMRDAFDLDVNESLQAATTLMDNFGLSSEQAFDFVVAGAQRGLNSSGDLLDTINEYSVQMGDAGVSAGEFFSLLEQGAQAGALGTDKIADAFKEFTLRVTEGGDDTKAAFEALGLDYDLLIEQYNAGTLTSVDLFNQVTSALDGVEQQTERDRIAFAIFGSQAEDVTTEVLAGVNLVEGALEDTEGAVESLDAQYQTASSNWQTETRKMQAALVPLGEDLQDIGARILPFVTREVERVTDAFEFWRNPLDNARQALDEIQQRISSGIGSFFGSPDLAVVSEAPDFAVVSQSPVAVPPSIEELTNVNASGVGGGGTTINVYANDADAGTAAASGVTQALQGAGR